VSEARPATAKPGMYGGHYWGYLIEGLKLMDGVANLSILFAGVNPTVGFLNC